MQRGHVRRDAILAATAAGAVDVDRLAARFAVSPSTIRRDLQALAERHAVTRTHGGAVLAPPQAATAEGTIEARRAVARGAKAAIAAAALALVRDGERLILDGGSTVEAMGAGLRQRRVLVVTGNLPLIPVLAGAPGVELLVLGGAVRPISMATTGPLAEGALRQVTADRCFLGADGVVPGRGLCEATLAQVSLKALMMAQATEVVVLADASKLGQASQPFWAALDHRPWTLVTDLSADPALCETFRHGGARVIRA